MNKLTNSKLVNIFTFIIIVVGLALSVVSCAPKPFVNNGCAPGFVWVPSHHLPYGKWVPGRCLPR